MDKEKEKISWKEVFTLHRRAFRLLSRFCPKLFLSSTLSCIVSAVAPYVTVYLSARIIDELAGSRRPEILWQWVVLAVLGGGLLSLACEGLKRWEQARWHYFFELQGRIFTDKFLIMDYADMDQQSTNDLYAQIIQNAGWGGHGLPKVPFIFQEMVTNITGIFSAVVLTAGLFLTRVPKEVGALTVLDHPIALLLLFLAVAVPTGLASWLSGKAGTYMTSAATADEGRMGNRLFSAFGFLADHQSRALDIRMYRQQIIARHYMDHDRIFSTDGLFGKLAAGPVGLLRAASACMSALLTGVVYVYVCLKAWVGAFGVGAATQYVAAVTALTGNVKGFLEQFANMQQNATFLKNVFAFLDMPNNMYQGSLTTEKRSDRQYDVEFRDVSFKYPGSENWSLRHVSVKFKVGRRMAVVGENGSGKSTFIKLLCRLYDPQEGQILLNGIDIRKYDLRDYMDVFSVVFQDFQLLSQPLGANVAGREDYDRGRVIKSLEDAGFGGRLSSMSEGLDTQLYGEFDDKGVTISGGEAQKIAIARALYKDAPFIILDEPTAALDPIAEAEIYAQFNEISGDKTAIYISHRLSSCRFCDEILVFDRGRIVEQGSHAGLLKDEGGKYYELWHAQAQYYEG